MSYNWSGTIPVEYIYGTTTGISPPLKTKLEKGEWLCMQCGEVFKTKIPFTVNPTGNNPEYLCGECAEKLLKEKFIVRKLDLLVVKKVFKEVGIPFYEEVLVNFEMFKKTCKECILRRSLKGSVNNIRPEKPETISS